MSKVSHFLTGLSGIVGLAVVATSAVLLDYFRPDHDECPHDRWSDDDDDDDHIEKKCKESGPVVVAAIIAMFCGAIQFLFCVSSLANRVDEKLSVLWKVLHIFFGFLSIVAFGIAVYFLGFGSQFPQYARTKIIIFNVLCGVNFIYSITAIIISHRLIKPQNSS